jgi:hypothetical protein
MVVTVAAGGHVLMMVGTGAERPAASEFGLGPRATSTGLYRVTLQPPSPLVKRKLQKVNVGVVDAGGRPVEGARIAVDGGMPEHGHGLPTRPRMTGRIGEGRYEIDGVRFNMGGWWEFKLKIAAAAGTDSVTFNLDL